MAKVCPNVHGAQNFFLTATFALCLLCIYRLNLGLLSGSNGGGSAGVVERWMRNPYCIKVLNLVLVLMVVFATVTFTTVWADCAMPQSNGFLAGYVTAIGRNFGAFVVVLATWFHDRYPANQYPLFQSFLDILSPLRFCAAIAMVLWGSGPVLCSKSVFIGPDAPDDFMFSDWVNYFVILTFLIDVVRFSLYIRNALQNQTPLRSLLFPCILRFTAAIFRLAIVSINLALSHQERTCPLSLHAIIFHSHVIDLLVIGVDMVVGDVTGVMRVGMDVAEWVGCEVWERIVRAYREGNAKASSTDKNEVYRGNDNGSMINVAKSANVHQGELALGSKMELASTDFLNEGQTSARPASNSYGRKGSRPSHRESRGSNELPPPSGDQV